ncbi:hypothetical protein [Amycolatopsis sp. NPDC049159]|uniref:hypothetical protein n=1 Tax=Amycolatopsis sp. NPDC049159 TaxID=3157210 RepID=UPI00340FD3A0
MITPDLGALVRPPFMDLLGVTGVNKLIGLNPATTGVQAITAMRDYCHRFFRQVRDFGDPTDEVLR